MNRLTIITCLIAASLCIPSFAQKKKTTNVKTPIAATHSAEQLIQNYKFTDAARVLQREIENAHSAGRSTDRLEQDLNRANRGIDMLRGTERITFIDSIKVSRDAVLKSLHLSHEAGRIINMNEEIGRINNAPQALGQTGYINELGDRIIFSASDKSGNNKRLYASFRAGKGWNTPIPLNGFDNTNEDQDYPFMMPDGVTLYYAAQGDESLGGYDLFVTRYNADTKQFLKAENLGMPFNSPANDYFLAIDEQTNLGWLVTDRYQKADSACIYIFIPNTTREVYDVADGNNKQIIHAAQLHSIAETQTNPAAVKEAQLRLAQAKAQQIQQASTPRRYIINDQIVYTQLTQFRSETARRIAEQADQVFDQINTLRQKQDELQLASALTPNKLTDKAKLQLQQIKQALPQLLQQYNTLCKNMRKAELQ